MMKKVEKEKEISHKAHNKHKNVLGLPIMVGILQRTFILRHFIKTVSVNNSMYGKILSEP